jgi:hypothetical protein
MWLVAALFPMKKSIEKITGTNRQVKTAWFRGFTGMSESVACD